MNNLETWCFLTTFVCRIDQLDEAKARHQRCVDVLRETNTVYFSSEDAFLAGQSEPTFGLLLAEIVPPGTKLSPQERDKYSTFVFSTVVEVPRDADGDGEEVRIVSTKLEIDFESGVPARFPSRTRGIRVSRSGHDIDGCIPQ